MDIDKLKREAREAARAKHTSHQTELNRIAREHGFTHWGSLASNQPKPSFELRWPSWSRYDDRASARELHKARLNKVHIVYDSESMAQALDHVVGFASTAMRLHEPETSRANGWIARPPEMVVIDVDLTRDWAPLRRLAPTDIPSLKRGTVVLTERMTQEYIRAATGRGLILVGAVEHGEAGTWADDVRGQIMGLYVPEIPEQDLSQIGRTYSKEDQQIIYATTAVKYNLPQRSDETISLIQGMVGPTTIRRRGASAEKRLRKEDFVRPGDIVRRLGKDDRSIGGAVD